MSFFEKPWRCISGGPCWAGPNFLLGVPISEELIYAEYTLHMMKDGAIYAISFVGAT